jgi:hypothetical protein
MINLLVGLMVAGAVLSSSSGVWQVRASGQVVQGAEGGAGQQQQRRGRGGPATVAEAEQRVRTAIGQALRNRLQLPDTLATRVSEVAFRYRDSSLYLQDREGYIRMQMRAEGEAARTRLPNHPRITCLMNEFFSTYETRVRLRLAEDREIGSLLTPLNRYRYLAFQENLHRTIDDALDDMRRRFGRVEPGSAGRRGGGAQARGGAAQPPPPGGPPGAQAGAAGPPAGMRGQGGPRGGIFASICPPGLADPGRGGS